MSKAGRTPLKGAIPEEMHQPLDQAKVEGAIVQMRQDADESLFELCDLAGDMKAIQMAELTAKFCAAAQIQMFKRIRESKRIKDLPLRSPDGGLRRAQTMEEFCPLVFGRSYRSMMEAEERFDLLGEEAYEAANRIGLNRSALRAARALPPEQLKVIQHAITTGSSKSEVLSVIEDLATKIVDCEARIEELQADSAAKDKVLADKNAVADKLRQQLQRVKKLPPDEILQKLLQETTSALHDTRGALIGHFRQALLALKQHHESHGGDSLVTMAGMVAQLAADVTALREEFGLPEVTGDAVPEWLQQEERAGHGARTTSVHTAAGAREKLKARVIGSGSDDAGT